MHNRFVVWAAGLYYRGCWKIALQQLRFVDSRHSEIAPLFPMRLNLTPYSVAGLLLVASACNNTTTPSSSNNLPGSVIANPEPGNLAPIIVDANASGQAPELRLLGASYGRLVDVYAYDSDDPNPNVIPIISGALIRASLVNDPDNFVLSTDRVTGQENLVIPKNINSVIGREQFNSLLDAATDNLDAIFDNGFGQAGFYSMVPRNSTLVLMFDDLLDPSLVNASNIETFVGPQPFGPFDARILPDKLHGDVIDFDGDGSQEFYTTRVLIDFTTNSFEAFQSSPTLPINPEGLPPAQDQNRDNVQVRIATAINGNALQTTRLANLTGHPLRPFANGSVDSGSPTQDIIRAFRSGGRTDVTGDEFNGFLRDDTAPNVVAALSGSIVAPPAQSSAANPNLFNLPVLRFSSADCAQTPAVDDVIFQTLSQGTVWARVAEIPNNDPDGLGNVTNVSVQVLAYPDAWDNGLGGVARWNQEGVGSVQFLSAYDPSADAGRERCFLETFPLSLGFPLNPAAGIPSTATWGLRFNEPMNEDSFSAYDGLRLTRVDPSVAELTAGDYAVTEITASTDRTRFSVAPHFPLNHQAGGNESYFLSIASSGLFAPTDLAGNSIAFPFAPIEGTLSGISEPTRNGTHVSLFTSADEEAPIADLGGDPGDPFPYAEWGGQHVYVTSRGAIAPRPVSRFTQVVERSNLFTQAMTQLAGGVEEPLARLGSLTQFLWRIYDFDMQLFDKDLSDPALQNSPWRLENSKLNIDVERVYWSPVTGGVTFDAFEGFSMRLSHGAWLPDEQHNVPMNTVAAPNTGMTLTFAQNQLSVTNDVPVETHLRPDGYTLDPGDKIQTALPTVLMPFPMNMPGSSTQRYYTWRDTSIIERAGLGGVGAPPMQYASIAGVFGTGIFPFENLPCDGTGGVTNFYFPGEVQTTALPLLLEFRCYPDTSATTANRLDVSQSQVTTNLPPFFRAFSTGGIDVNQDPAFVDPDTEITASGGFDPTSAPIPGAPTPGTDKNVYIGGVDFVVRVSRSYSVWFPTPDTTNIQIDSPRFYTSVVEPKPADQPPGTSIEFAYRGSIGMLNAFPTTTDDTLGGFRMTSVAQLLDPYGDHYLNTTICADPGDGLMIPPEPNFPFQVINHNSFDANLDALGILAGGRWFEDIADVNGCQFIQVRASFISNAETGLAPILSSLALGWRE